MGGAGGTPARGDWPRGATSDDTEQLLLVASYLVEANGHIDERDFLDRLAKALPKMRGAGPTTQAAVRRFLTTGELHATDGSSIGAAMRALPFGWATPVVAAMHRRELTTRISNNAWRSRGDHQRLCGRRDGCLGHRAVSDRRRGSRRDPGS